jgi:hypothetical protein
VSWHGAGSQRTLGAVLAGDVADVMLVAPGALDNGELPPQPVSTTEAASTAVTPAKSRRPNASTLVASMAVTAGDRLSAEAGDEAG